MTASNIESLRSRIAEEQQRRAVLEDRKAQAETALEADLRALQEQMGSEEPVTVEAALIESERLEKEALRLEAEALATLEGTVNEGL